MVLKIISATEAKSGSNIIIDGEAYAVKKIDISKTGKHGASKCRIEAIGIISGQKKIVAVPGHERFEVPLSISGERASVMDLESFETLDMEVPEELRAEVVSGSTVEYWDVEGQKVIKRKL